MKVDELFESAKNTLEGNWNGSFTIPSPTLYPHQWSWDSAFIAIGNSYFNIERAIKELEFLFDAQWNNGMVPHIVFNEKEKTYFPAADFYEITRSPNAPRHIGTSGMTQPPVHAIACYYIYKNDTDQEKIKSKKSLRKLYPKLRLFHKYLMKERDPEKSGLVTILHPWESGLDDSPVWDHALSQIKIRHTLKFERLDVKAVGGAKETIPSDDMYNKFIYMIELMKRYNYDEQKMYENFPFKIKAIVFSSILYIANKYLLKIADILQDETDIEEIREWVSRTERNFYKYFLPSGHRLCETEDSLFYNYDLISRKWIRKKTISSLIPIYTGLIPIEEVASFLKYMIHWSEPAGKTHSAALPSVDPKEPYFKEITYWRGPVWVNINWMIWLGLLMYGYKEQGELIKQGIFELVRNHGFREYYDPYTGEGLGGKSFSWTAALVIDMIRESKGAGVHPS
jgi:Glycosyl hydrolase family 63 C-terminal domain